MALDFPTSPALNDIYTYGGRSWQWNGTAWDVYSTVSGNVVTQLNGLTGGVTLAAGTNITLTPTGNTITINSAGGSGGVSQITAGPGITLNPAGGTGVVQIATLATVKGTPGMVQLAAVGGDLQVDTGLILDPSTAQFKVPNGLKITSGLGLAYIEFADGTTQGTAAYGVMGGTGATGSQGPQGNTGATGSQGPQGNTGATGPQGNTGATGPVGDYVISIRGLTGSVGLTAGAGITISVSGQTMTVATVITNENTSSERYIAFYGQTTGTDYPRVDLGLQYTPSNQTISGYGGLNLSGASTGLVSSGFNTISLYDPNIGAITIASTTGNVLITTPNAYVGDRGSLSLLSQDAMENGFVANIVPATNYTGSRQFTLPDDSGTVALTKNVVSSVNGSTGAVQVVSRFNGLTGAVGLTNGSGIGLSVSGNTLTVSNTGVLSVNGATGAITNVAKLDENQTFTGLNTFTNLAEFTADISMNEGAVSKIEIGSVGDLSIGAVADVRTRIRIDDDGEQISHYATSGHNFFNSSVNANSGISSAGGTFSALTRFTAGISASGGVTLAGTLQGTTANFTGFVSSTVGFSGSGTNLINIVKTINGLSGGVTLAAGSNITLTPSGNTLTISGATFFKFVEGTSASPSIAGDRWFDTNTGKFFTAVTDNSSPIWIESGGVGSGNATTTTTLDFSEQINQIKLRVGGNSTIYGNNLSVFNNYQISDITLTTDVAINVVTFSNIVSYNAFYDTSLSEWVMDIIAKPPFLSNTTAETLSTQTFLSMAVSWTAQNVSISDDWTVGDGGMFYNPAEIIHKPETFVTKTLTGLTWAASDSFISCKIMGLTSADHTAEDAILEGVQFEINNIVPGTGFDIIGHAPEGTYGKYTVKCLGQ